MRRTRHVPKHRAGRREGPSPSDGEGVSEKNKACLKHRAGRRASLPHQTGSPGSERAQRRRSRAFSWREGGKLSFRSGTLTKLGQIRCVSDTLVKMSDAKYAETAWKASRGLASDLPCQSTYLKRVQPNLESLRKVDYQADGD